MHHVPHLRIQADPRGAFGQGNCMQLLLPLPHDGLTAQPFRHGLLIAGTSLAVNLQPNREVGLCHKGHLTCHAAELEIMHTL